MIKFVYLVVIIIGVVGGVKVIWGILDLVLVFIVVLNVIVLLLLSRKVKVLYIEFFIFE